MSDDGNEHSPCGMAPFMLNVSSVTTILGMIIATPRGGEKGDIMIKTFIVTFVISAVSFAALDFILRGLVS